MTKTLNYKTEGWQNTLNAPSVHIISLYLALSCKAPDLSTIFANGKTEQTLPIPKPSKTPPHPSHKGREWLLLTKWPHRQYINPSHQCRQCSIGHNAQPHETMPSASRNNAHRLTRKRKHKEWTAPTTFTGKTPTGGIDSLGLQVEILTQERVFLAASAIGRVECNECRSGVVTWLETKL